MRTNISVKTNKTFLPNPARRVREQPVSVLSRSELRRIVAEMLD
jgi:hypothetical protein